MLEMEILINTHFISYSVPLSCCHVCPALCLKNKLCARWFTHFVQSSEKHYKPKIEWVAFLNLFCILTTKIALKY